MIKIQKKIAPVRKRKKKSVFDKHPNGEEIMLLLLNDQITKAEAARRLGCSRANVSTWNTRHGDAMKRKYGLLDPHTLPLPPAPAGAAVPIVTPDLNGITKQVLDKEIPSITVDINDNTPLEQIGAHAWRMLLLALINKLKKGETSINEEIQISREVRHFLQFQFTKEVPDISDPLIQLNPEQLKELETNMVTMCDNCEYRKGYVEYQAREQEAARVEFT